MRAKKLLFLIRLRVTTLLMTLCLCTVAFAQSTVGGTIAGQIHGPGEVLVPGARVVLFNMETRARKETWSDETGRYEFRDVAPGEYRIIVMILGFRPSLLGPVKVTAGKQPLALNATLSLATPGEQAGVGGFRRPGRAGPE